MAKDTLYLTVGNIPDPDGRKIAVITLGSPQMGDDEVVVLTLTEVKSQGEAEQWFKKMKEERPWETRN
jgi:hypothetical protein